jgi:hypothetical protein
MEDMLRACVLTYGKDWEQSLPYAEFSYNNGYQASLGMSPFEALYGRKCRTPLMWFEVGERALVGPALIKEAEERVAEIREKLKAAQSRQKSYADKKRREVSFSPGDFAYLKVSPIRGTRIFQVHGKLAPRYIGPYKVLKRVGEVAYRLELPEEMSDIHPVFHISQLRRCLKVLEEKRVPVETIDFAPRFLVSGGARQDSGHSGQKDKDIRSTGLQSPMEKTWSRRSHVGTRGLIEERVSPPVQELAESRGRDSF